MPPTDVIAAGKAAGMPKHSLSEMYKLQARTSVRAAAASVHACASRKAARMQKIKSAAAHLARAFAMT
jgi:hypothetical protein